MSIEDEPVTGNFRETFGMYVARVGIQPPTDVDSPLPPAWQYAGEVTAASLFTRDDHMRDWRNGFELEWTRDSGISVLNTYGPTFSAVFDGTEEQGRWKMRCAVEMCQLTEWLTPRPTHGFTCPARFLPASGGIVASWFYASRTDPLTMTWEDAA